MSFTATRIRAPCSGPGGTQRPWLSVSLAASTTGGRPIGSRRTAATGLGARRKPDGDESGDGCARGGECPSTALPTVLVPGSLYCSLWAPCLFAQPRPPPPPLPGVSRFHVWPWTLSLAPGSLPSSRTSYLLSRSTYANPEVRVRWSHRPRPSTMARSSGWCTALVPLPNPRSQQHGLLRRYFHARPPVRLARLCLC